MEGTLHRYETKYRTENTFCRKARGSKCCFVLKIIQELRMKENILILTLTSTGCGILQIKIITGQYFSWIREFQFGV